MKFEISKAAKEQFYQEILRNYQVIFKDETQDIIEGENE
jgi:hypothetical protein